MAKKNAVSKGKEKEKEKATEKPVDNKKRDPGALSTPVPAQNKASAPAVQPAPTHVVRELVTVQEESEDEIEKMDILQSRGASDSAWGNVGDGGNTHNGSGGWEGGGAGWSQDHYDDGQNRGDPQTEDGWEEDHNALTGQWESKGQNMYSPNQMPAVPPGSPPPLLTPPPVSFPHPEVGATKVTKHSDIPGTELGAQQQPFGQFQAQPLQPSSNDDPGRIPLNEAAMVHRTANVGFSSTGGAKMRSTGHDSRGANPRGGPYWGPPSAQTDPLHHTQRSEPRSALKAAGGTSLAKANTPWGQPKNTDPWGEPKPSSDSRHQYPISNHGTVHGTTKAWETWGKPAGWTRPTYEDDDDDSSDETVDGWGAAPTWDMNPQREDDWGWQAGAKKQSKVTFAPSGSGGTQRVLSSQEHSQILGSLLNLPNQNHNTNIKPGHHGHQQPIPHSSKPIQTQHHHPQYQSHHYPIKHKHEQVNQQFFNQQFQQQQQQQFEYPQDQGQGTKKNKKTKHGTKLKQTPTEAWESGGWGGDDNNGREVGDNSWGNDGWGDQGDGRGDTAGGKDGWGGSNAGGAGWGGGSNDNWGTGGGNDGWGQAGSSKGAWGAETATHEQWDQWGGAKKGKEKGKGKNTNNWDAAEEEGDSDTDEWGTPYDHRKSKRSTRSSVQIETPYTMPSRTLAHAYRGTAVSLNSSVIDRNKIKEYTNIHFIESKGAALHPVHNALFGTKFRMAKDRIHWLFSPDKDERVSMLLAWIQTMEYSLGAFGLHKFLQSRERGALFANANYRPENNPGQPAFDWINFDDLQQTRDKTIQESVVSYNPALQVVIFVFLPSKTGNSVAMWRRKVNVPNNTRLMLQNEIQLALAGLRKQEAYEVHVDELPPPGNARLSRHQRHKSLPTPATNPVEKKKKRKWWQFLRFET